MGFFVPADTRQGLPATYTPPPARTPPPTTPPPAGGLPPTYTPPPRGSTSGGTVRTPTPDEVMAHLRDIYTPAGALPHSQADPTVPPLKGDVPFGTTPPATTAKTTTTTPATTTSTDYSHRLPGESTQDWVVRWAKGNNRPDIAADPSYWVSAINSKPQSDDMGYWVDKISTPDQGNSALGGSAGGFGAFTAPFTGTYVPPVTNFQAPVGTDDPGFKFAVEQGQDAIQRSAAAKGNLLTGGTLKDLASYTTGAALQDYAGSYNRALSTAGFNNNTAFQAFGQNYDIFRNNQNDPFQKLYATTGLGLNAAGNANSSLGGYANNLSDLTNNFATQYTGLTTGQGNANALGTQISSAQRDRFYSSLSDWLKTYKF